MITNRIIANIIDEVISWVTYFLSSIFLLAIHLQATTDLTAEEITPDTIQQFEGELLMYFRIVIIVQCFLYFTILPKITNGYTFGKIITRIRVVDANSEPATLQQHIKRNARFQIFSIWFVLTSIITNSTIALIIFSLIVYVLVKTISSIVKTNGEQSFIDKYSNTKVIKTN